MWGLGFGIGGLGLGGLTSRGLGRKAWVYPTRRELTRNPKGGTL